MSSIKIWRRLVTITAMCNKWNRPNDEIPKLQNASKICNRFPQMDTTKIWPRAIKFQFEVQVESLKQLPQLCNNSSDISHPQNCSPIESFHSQWEKTIVETLGSTTIKHQHQQQQICLVRMKPRMPIYSFFSTFSRNF